MKKKFLLNMILFALTLSSVGIVKDNAKTSFAEEKVAKKVTIEITERAKKFIEGIEVYYDGKTLQYKPGEKYPVGSEVVMRLGYVCHFKIYDSKGNKIDPKSGGGHGLSAAVDGGFYLPDSEKVTIDFEYDEGNFETVSGGKKFKRKNGKYAGEEDAKGMPPGSASAEPMGDVLINGDIYRFDLKTSLMKTGWEATPWECQYYNEEGKLQRNTWINGYYADFWGLLRDKPGGKFITEKDIQKIVDKNKDKPKIGDKNKDKPKIDDKNKDKPKNNQILTDKNGNKVESKTFDFKNLKFNVEKLNEKVDKLNGKVYDLFDISFKNKDGKNKKLPNGEYLVTLQKENGKEVEKVYYVDDNGNIEEREFTQTQKEVTFKTNHFSKYAILYKTTEKKPIIEKTKNRSSLAKTSISSYSLVLTGLALAGTTFTFKKRNK